MAQADRERKAERRLWDTLQAVVSTALALGLAWSLGIWWKLNGSMPLADWQRALGWLLLVGGFVGFAGRALFQWSRRTPS